ncbi:Uncharacterised protein [[Clostridium] sordellii]|uniref:hypothetical protein n=1 Tax=Paraclostridium sordellii TaxID=1505 RepID=UPI0005E83EBF|nr:hypothetical protein [Paeniclostridium sordellii]AUN14754.1 hypothetical protein RSJ16_11200 [Paeniclostridium sordellii]MCR1848425.1 hypothetical protein [Paeniclostridium sordellii]MDU5022122.1 hypothetical protein [Clostridiales bacterium]CEN90632.1 Uncharacterised protein [[Clostridium] sordellii] [Paeniclostridium sordellii]
MLRKKRNLKNNYRKIVNDSFEQQDILSSYMSMLNQMKTCSYNSMCNDIDLYHRYCDVKFEDNDNFDEY